MSGKFSKIEVEKREKERMSLSSSILAICKFGESADSNRHDTMQMKYARSKQLNTETSDRMTE
jgi:hypothetical protein